MKQNQVIQINVKNGFYIGDLSYALSSKVYSNVWGQGKFGDGAYLDPTTGAQFASVSTADGEGGYFGSDGTDYTVSADSIGICDLELVHRPQEGLGRIVEDYSGMVCIEYFNGKVIIDWAEENVVIDTNPLEADLGFLGD